MLLELYLKNITVVETASLRFKPGFNVITGETGAGKSVIIKSILALTGGRFGKEMIRFRQETAQILAIFEKADEAVSSLLESLGIELERDGRISVERKISVSGRSDCRINGVPVLLSVLNAVMSRLVDLHGQFENQKLQNTREQLKLIDDFGGLSPQIEQYQKLFERHQQRKSELSELVAKNRDKVQKADFLNFQIQEIELALLAPGEEEALVQKKAALQNREKIKASLEQICAQIGGNESEGVRDRLEVIARELEFCGGFEDEIKPYAEVIKNVFFELEDVGTLIEKKLLLLDADGPQINEIESRLDLIYRLKRKYGGDIPEILRFCEEAHNELEQLCLASEQEESLQKEVEEICEILKKQAILISSKRTKAAVQFAKSVEVELASLLLPYVKFVCSHRETEMNKLGIDEVCFEISTNKGEPVKPLAKVASGGELSRVMLAIKNVKMNKWLESCVIFDEIDSGISGEAAKKVAEKLKQLSKNYQVICVTHLAQIAALADTHFLVEKSVKLDRTFSEVRSLKESERVREIARIIGGDPESQTAQESARELVDAGAKGGSR